MITIIADIAGTIGMLLFLTAEIRQFYKIKKTGKLTGISFHAYLSKLIAVASTGVCFALTTLYFSLFVIILEGIVIMPVLYWLWKKRKVKHIKTSLEELWDNPYNEGWNAT
jgi:SNF family Na+-dependent transporter